MPVEFISATHISDEHRKVGAGFGGFDPDYTRRFAHALDDAGFDWTLIAYGSPSPDSLQLGQFVANNTERVKPMIAHRRASSSRPRSPRRSPAWTGSRAGASGSTSSPAAPTSSSAVRVTT